MKVLFVCLGNICRSPLLEVVTRARFAAAQVGAMVASAGTGGWHTGGGADPRAIAAGRERGYDLSRHVARQVQVSDFDDFDLVLAADISTLQTLRQRVHASAHGHIELALTYAGIAQPLEVPDPYYGGARDFEHVVSLSERVAEGLIVRLSQR